MDRANRFVDEVCRPYQADWPLSDYDADQAVAEKIRREFTGWGFRGLAVPVEAGSQGLGALAKSLVFETLWRSPVLRGLTLLWPAFLDPSPALHRAPRWQRAKYLDPVLAGEKQYHICLSEPEHGSHAAGIQLRAERQGDHFVLNGLKRWTPDPCHFLTRPDYGFRHAQTQLNLRGGRPRDPAPRRHRLSGRVPDGRGLVPAPHRPARRGQRGDDET